MVLVNYMMHSIPFLVCSGVIGFLLCSTEGPHVDFVNPINPIEKLEGADKHRRNLRFYNSEVSIWSIYCIYLFKIIYWFKFCNKISGI